MENNSNIIKISEQPEGVQACLYKVELMFSNVCRRSQSPRDCGLTYFISSQNENVIYVTIQSVDGDIMDGIKYKFEYLCIKIKEEELYKLTTEEYKAETKNERLIKIEIE